MSSNSSRENSDSRGFDNKEIILFIRKKPGEEDIQEQCFNLHSALPDGLQTLPILQAFPTSISRLYPYMCSKMSELGTISRHANI